MNPTHIDRRRHCLMGNGNGSQNGYKATTANRKERMLTMFNFINNIKNNFNNARVNNTKLAADKAKVDESSIVNAKAVKDAVAKLTATTTKAIAFKESIYSYEELVAYADSMSDEIFTHMFAVVNIVSRFTHITDIATTFGALCNGLGETPSMSDIGTMMKNIEKIGIQWYRDAKAAGNVDTMEALKELCAGQGVLTRAYLALSCIRNKVAKRFSGAVKIEVNNRIAIGFGKAIKTVGEALHKGMELIIGAIVAGIGLAAAFAIEFGRVVKHIVSTAIAGVKWIASKISNNVGNNVKANNNSDDEASRMQDAVNEMMNAAKNNMNIPNADKAEKQEAAQATTPEITKEQQEALNAIALDTQAQYNQLNEQRVRLINEFGMTEFQAMDWFKAKEKQLMTEANEKAKAIAPTATLRWKMGNN